MRIDATSRRITEVMARLASVREQKARLAELAARRDVAAATARRTSAARAQNAAEASVLSGGAPLSAGMLQTALGARHAARVQLAQLDRSVAAAQNDLANRSETHRAIARVHLGATHRADAVRQAYVAIQADRARKALEDATAANRLARASGD